MTTYTLLNFLTDARFNVNKIILIQRNESITDFLSCYFCLNVSKVSFYRIL